MGARFHGRELRPLKLRVAQLPRSENGVRGYSGLATLIVIGRLA